MLMCLHCGKRVDKRDAADTTKGENGGMAMISGESEYSAYDRPEILLFLFHPRREDAGEALPPGAKELSVPVNGGVHIGARFYPSDKKSPNMLFFHGNGEIVADYADLAPVFNRMGINFIPVDYRGYGKSSGDPTVSSMMQDCRIVFKYVSEFLKSRGYNGKIVIMGRSLGSASALELAYHYPDEIDGLIIESGFAYAVPLLRHLGLNTDSLGITEEGGFRNIEKIKGYRGPTLVIHAQYDQIITFSDGKALYDASPAEKKWFLRIPGADHNTIFLHGLNEYLASVKQLMLEVEK